MELNRKHMVHVGGHFAEGGEKMSEDGTKFT